MTIKKQREIISFFKETIKGIRGEYEKGWSPRSLKEDIDTLANILVDSELKGQNEPLRCVHRGCKELQGADSEFCNKHFK